MPYITEHQSAELFMEHDGVEIYHVYRDNDFDQGARTYWFAVHDDGDDDAAHGHHGVFDVRQLPEPPSPPSLNDRPPFIGADDGREAGFATYEDWKNSSEYARRSKLWDAWHEAGETDAIRNKIRYAIDIGVITPTGIAGVPADPDDGYRVW
ncbi:hypothetical protein ATER59S_00541 [Aquamicrobium terrae]